jgi:hypothetical protein
MRLGVIVTLMSFAAVGTVVAAPADSPPASTPLPTCSNPGGLGISRVVEIDTTGGPAFGTAC